MESDRHRIVFEYYPEIKKEDIKQENREFVFYNVSNCGYSDNAGNPMLSERCVLIGLPIGASAEVNVLESDFYEERVKIVPVPSVNRRDDIAEEDYVIDENVYKTDGWLRNGVYDYGSPEFLRRQRVQKISIYPVDYYPKKELSRIYRKVKIEVSFLNADESHSKYYPDVSFENVYESLILNYEECKDWRIFSEKKMLKRTGQDEGEWYKITVDEEGMYIIDKNFLDLKNIDLSGVDPATIRIYNNGGRELPYDIDSDRVEGLIENSIYVHGEDDKRFDDNDFILFYGIPAYGWDYSGIEAEHYINHYQDENIYWLTFGGALKGKRMNTKRSVEDNDSFKPENFRWRVFVEEEFNKIHQSGLHWYGMEFRNGDTKEMKIQVPGYAGEDNIKYKIAFKGGSAGRHSFAIFEESRKIGDLSFFAFGEFDITKIVNVNLTDAESRLTFNYSSTVPEGRAFIDWIEIEYTRDFTVENNVLFFNSPKLDGPVEYSVSGFMGNELWVFDVTNFSDVERITDYTLDLGKIIFGDTVSSDYEKIYAVVEESGFKRPVGILRDENSDLRIAGRSADFIIITYDDFYNEGLILESHRESADGLKTEVVKISNIYDEFSCGLTDPVAIRDFLRYAYLNWRDDGNPPGYVLLIGDGSYDFKNILNKEGKNYIPPFEIDSDNDLYSRCTDDWYVYVDGDDNLMDMAIGRLPVASKSEAISVANKLVDYEEDPEFGFWRSTITFVADDELTPGDKNQRIHTDQSESIANAQYVPGILNKRKICLMDYPGEKSITTAGIIKPGAERDFIEQMNRGTSIISYIGHGSYKVLAQERVLNLTEDLPLIENGKKLFFFYPATCAFGRYDMPDVRTFAEELLVKENSGAVGLFNSTREAFASQNFNLAQNFYRSLFSEVPTQRLGNAVMAAKLMIPGNLVNNEKFHLFCDPTLRLSLPVHRTSAIKISPDTMKALATVSVSGNILKDNQMWDDFEGKISLMCFDTEQNKTHIMEDGGEVPYKLSGASIFRGISAIKRNDMGEFNLGFIVPKDITYGGQKGRASLYFFNESTDGAGYLDNINVGGTADVENDFNGPAIDFGFEGIDFVSGDFIPENPILSATISDENGINITGEIGHKIEFIIDADTKSGIDLTDNFVYKDGSFTEGELRYPLFGLSKGIHVMKLKAWDNFNNSSTSFAEFTIYSEDEFKISKLFNYPNPFSDETRFTFEINQPIDSISDVTIKIYTISGRLVKKIEDIIVEKPGYFVSDCWDGRDADGDRIANGVYFFKIIIRAQIDNEAKTAESIGKLVVLR
ncbi:type IX secretion system sortase PorU [candidate division KSB1 bacterium]